MKAGLSEYVAEIDRQSEIPNHGSLSGSVLHSRGGVRLSIFMCVAPRICNDNSERLDILSFHENPPFKKCNPHDVP